MIARNPAAILGSGRRAEVRCRACDGPAGKGCRYEPSGVDRCILDAHGLELSRCFGGATATAPVGDQCVEFGMGLLAQCVDPYDAAVAGAWIHAQAGVRAATALGNSACVMAGDLIEGMIDTLASLA